MTNRPAPKSISFALAVLASATCGDGPIVPADSPRPAASIQLTGMASAVDPGATVTVDILVRDGRQEALPGAELSLEVLAGNGTISPRSIRTDAHGRATASWKIGPRPGLHRMRAVSGAISADASVTALDLVLTELRIDELPPVARTGETIGVSVMALDQTGGPMGAVPITAIVILGGGSVPQGPIATGTNGRASLLWTLGPDAGEQRLRLGSADRSAEASVMAERPALGGFGTVTGTSQEGPVSAALDDPIVVEVLDTDGLPYAEVPLAWRVVSGGGTVAPEGAGTGVDGRQSARWTLGPSVGEQRLEVVADDGEGRRASLVVAATAFEGIRISTTLSSMRDELAVEVAMSARGGAEESGYTWSVVGGGLPPGVQLSTDGVLGGTPDSEGVFAFAVRATDALGVSGDRGYEVRVCEAALQLGVGDADVRTYPSQCGALLPANAGAVYRVGVMARGRDHGHIQPVEGGLLLRTRLEGSVGAATAVQAVAPTRAAPVPGVRVDHPDAGWLHRRSLDAAARAQRPVVRPHSAAIGLRAVAATAPPAARRDFLVYTPEGKLLTVAATLRAYSATVAYYEEEGIAADGGTIYDQARIEATLAWHDTNGEPVLQEAFGGYGPPGTVRVFKDEEGVVQERQVGDFDGNGRLVALQLRPTFMRGAQGFATACDLLPRPEHAANGSASCEASNEAEVVYVRGPGRSLLVHEAKHVTSVAWTLYGGRDAHFGWIEEGTAVLASELASRRAAGVLPTQRVGAAEIFAGGQPPASDSDAYVMWVVTRNARAYLAAAPFSGITGDPVPNPTGSSFYSSSWLFHRYVIDAYGKGDPHGLMRRLNTVSGGTRGLEAETGRTMSQLFTELMRAAIVDDVPAAWQAGAPRFESYAFADILAAEGLDWPVFVVTRSYTTVAWELPTWETAANLFEFEAEGVQPMEIEVAREDGTALGPEHDVALLIVRVR